MPSPAAIALSQYVQIDTTNPPGNERPAAEWLIEQLAQRSITENVRLVGPDPERPILLATVPGTNPALPPLLLNHHMDVVPAEASEWSHGPFSGDIAEGYVWGRGTLDTKSLGIMFMMALEELRERQPERTIIFCAVSDEEAGGECGMAWLVENMADELNPAWVWDEGGYAIEGMFPDVTMATVSVAEKYVQQLSLSTKGDPGHGSMPKKDSAPWKLVRALHRLEHPRPIRINAVTGPMLARMGAVMPGVTGWIMRHLNTPVVGPILCALAGGKLGENANLSAMLRDTVSLTIVDGGYKANVIPASASATIDCRLLPDTDPETFHTWLRERVGPEVEITVEMGSEQGAISPVDGPFIAAMDAAVARHMPDATVTPIQMPAASDSRYWRAIGVPAYGIAPARLDVADLGRVHGIDERLSVEALDASVTVCRDVIETLCYNQEETQS